MVKAAQPAPTTGATNLGTSDLKEILAASVPTSQQSSAESARAGDRGITALSALLFDRAARDPALLLFFVPLLGCGTAFSIVFAPYNVELENGGGRAGDMQTPSTTKPQAERPPPLAVGARCAFDMKDPYEEGCLCVPETVDAAEGTCRAGCTINANGTGCGEGAACRWPDDKLRPNFDATYCEPGYEGPYASG